MLIENERRQVFRLTLTGYELAALISSARWAAEGGKGELTPSAVDHLKQVLENYDKATARLNGIDVPGQNQRTS
jgi:hypothetical protein